MIRADRFLVEARERGFGLWSGVPCSYLTPFVNGVIDSELARYVGAANEGDAVAIASGAELAGERGVALFQNSGLGNAINPLTSLNHTFRIPILVITTLRGDPDGEPDEPQHELMGRVTGKLLDAIDVRWEFFPTEESAIARVLDRALDAMDASGKPYALVMRKGTAEKRALESARAARSTSPLDASERWTAESTRRALLAAVVEAVPESDVVVATTGYTGRELFALRDRPNHLYMVGSMGCASSLGLGLALTRPERRVVVLDGDGAALMRLGSFATIGHERPPNLVHVVLDNGVHESTGGQATVSRSLDFPALAAACGYSVVTGASTPAELAAVLERRTPGPVFVHAPTLPGIDGALPRPTLRPFEIAARLRAHIAR